MRLVHRFKLAGAAACVGMLVGGVALATLIPGGGDKRSDCYVELDVLGASGSNHFTCTDGDPACDTDGQCQGTCTFSIAVCVNQTNVAGCTPTNLRRPPIVGRRELRAQLPAIHGTDSACGAFVSIPVKLVSRHGGRKLPGHAKIGTRAGGKDKDHLFLTCMPRTDACPAQTTTTTSSTTTTTRP